MADILTIGHSNHPLEAFLKLLTAHPSLTLPYIRGGKRKLLGA